MSVKKKCTVVMLPTNEKATLHLSKGDKLTNNHCNLKGDENWQSQHLYILSDDKIRQDDWMIRLFDNAIIQDNFNSDNRKGNANQFKKIIATTDTSISIKKGEYNIGEIKRKIIIPTEKRVVANISIGFIQAYIKAHNEGNPITEIMVDYENNVEESWMGDNYTGQPFLSEKIELKVNSKDNTITITKIKCNWNRDEIYEIVKKFSAYKTGSFTSNDLNWFKENV